MKRPHNSQIIHQTDDKYMMHKLRVQEGQKGSVIVSLRKIPFSGGHPMPITAMLMLLPDDMVRLRDDLDKWVKENIEKLDNHPDNPLHQWFGLSYANYFVMPRLALQAMPAEWQTRFINLIGEIDKAGIETPDYHVLRDDPMYTTVTNYDQDDATSSPYQYTILEGDPWANYRHPDKSLLPAKVNKETS